MTNSLRNLLIVCMTILFTQLKVKLLVKEIDPEITVITTSK